jgi:hypothetical protein
MGIYFGKENGMDSIHSSWTAGSAGPWWTKDRGHGGGTGVLAPGWYGPRWLAMTREKWRGQHVGLYLG